MKPGYAYIEKYDYDISRIRYLLTDENSWQAAKNVGKIIGLELLSLGINDFDIIYAVKDQDKIEIHFQLESDITLYKVAGKDRSKNRLESIKLIRKDTVSI